MMRKKVAILSDVIMKYGGAEKVLEALLEMYPKSDLFTLFIVPSARKKLNKLFPEVVIRTSWWQRFVWSDVVSKYISVIKVLSWVYWERLDLSSYDLVISSSHSFMSKNVRTGDQTFHLSYVHTPPRYLYDEYNEIGFIRRWPVSIFFWPIKILLRWIDYRGSTRPNILVANSRNVQLRIKKYYNRDSVVVYPPVDSCPANLASKHSKGGYYVWVSRLVKQKGIYQVVEACEGVGRKLLVVGGGDEYQKLIRRKYKWVTFVGPCDDNEKYQILGGAKALLYTSIDEDFGIVPVESLKMGVPVIAYNSGGVREVVIDKKNGVLYDEYEVISLQAAIRKFEGMTISPEKCKQSVSSLGKKYFQEKIRNIIVNTND